MSDEDSAKPERRSALRVPAGELQAQLEVPRSSDVLYLSTSGMMVRPEFLPAIGAEHKFTLRFPDRNMEVHAIVRNGEHLEGSAGEFLAAFVAERLAE